jgi:hypothetical protein
MRLVFDDSPNLTYRVRYEGEISFDRAWVGHSEFTLDLIADTPYAEEDEESETGSITTSPASITVLSSGTVDTPAVVTITNTGVADVDGFSLIIQYTEDLV